MSDPEPRDGALLGANKALLLLAIAAVLLAVGAVLLMLRLPARGPQMSVPPAASTAK